MEYIRINVHNALEGCSTRVTRTFGSLTYLPYISWVELNSCGVQLPKFGGRRPPPTFSASIYRPMHESPLSGHRLPELPGHNITEQLYSCQTTRPRGGPWGWASIFCAVGVVSQCILTRAKPPETKTLKMCQIFFFKEVSPPNASPL